MKKVIDDIISIISPKEKRSVALFIVINTIINLADVFALVCLLFVIKFYTQPLAFNTHNPLLSLIFQREHSLLPVLILMIMFTVKNIAGHLAYKAQVKFISGVAVRISRQNLSAYLDGPYFDYANVDSSVFVRRIIHQPTEFAQHVLQSAQQVVTELLLITFSIAALMIYNAHLFIIVLLTLLPAIVILSWLTKKRLERIKKDIKVVVEQSLQYLNEALKGYIESNIYNKNAFFIKRHEEAQKRVSHHIAGIQTTQDMPARFFEVFAILGLFVLIVAIKYATRANSTDVVIVGAFIAAAYKIIPSVSKIINLTGQIRTYGYAIEGIHQSSLKQHRNNVSGNKIGAIEFKDAHFSYDKLKVLDGFNCSVQAGAFVGISGASGSGKTTLFQLLLGFCNPNSGSILFNEEIVDDQDRIAHWNRIAYVKQEPFILHDSILNNIVLFDAEYDADRLTEVLKVTGLKEIADRFPEGIYTPIMEGGKNLSGGQRKRVALARALYKGADLILLDEPFSELDELSESKMLQYLKQLALNGKMVILIAHGPKSFKYCDQVINVYQQ